MKTLIALLTLSVGAQTFADGPSTSGGGDSYVAEFILTARYDMRVLPGTRNGQSGLASGELGEWVQKVQVVSVDHLYLNGVELDAINHPQELKIEISRSRWNELRADLRKKMVLVYHEYLSIAGQDDHNYSISSSIMPVTTSILEMVCDAFKDWNHISDDKIFLKVSWLNWFQAVAEIVNSKEEFNMTSASSPFVTIGYFKGASSYNVFADPMGFGALSMSFDTGNVVNLANGKGTFTAMETSLVDPQGSASPHTVSCQYRKY